MYPRHLRSPDGRLYKRQDGPGPDRARRRGAGDPGRNDQHAQANLPGSILPRPAKIVVKVGKPLDFSRYDGLQGNRFIERAITDEIMYSLMELSDSSMSTSMPRR